MVQRRTRKRGGGLSDSLPITTWGHWSNYPGALAWSANSSAPAPLANGGLYTNPQSTGAWASQPFPATQYALSIESAKTSNIPEVFYHQRVNANDGNSFSPYVGSPISSQHYSATMGPHIGGGRKERQKTYRVKARKRVTRKISKKRYI
jgi:hypothetical protein